MKKPICEFLEKYDKTNPIRLHVPGHKGKSVLGYEGRDLTEIDGADELYLPSGIIKESQQIASNIFNCPTYYTVEGSSHAIRAMLYLTKIYSQIKGKSYKVLATRNVHKSFLSACALLDAEVVWLNRVSVDNYFSNYLTVEYLENYLKNAEELPCALYVTSPDYLGNLLDIENIANVLKKYDILLLVDNAHGAYLNFLGLHPITLGASTCADSAHKTLPVLTGGAYLHLSNELSLELENYVYTALSLFGTTSPSYLILSSLDNANEYLSDGYKDKLISFIGKLNGFKAELKNAGYKLIGNEPLKITIDANGYGYYGYELNNILKEKGIYAEFYDKDYIVLMFTPQILDSEIEVLKNALLSLPKKEEIKKEKIIFNESEKVLTLRESINSLTETISVDDSENRIYCDFNLPCPPAVPIIMPGERITKNTIETFKYYEVKTVKVSK